MAAQHAHPAADRNADASTPAAIFAAPVFERVPASRLRRPATLPDCVRATPELALRAARFGQIRPVLADAAGVVWGGLDEYLALTAAFATGDADAPLPDIACRVLPEDATAPARFTLACLHEGEALNKSPILRAWMASEMLSALDDADLLPLLPLLDLPRRREAALECARLLRLPEAVRAALHQGLLLPRALPSFRRLPEAEQETLVMLIRKYRLGGSKQQQLAERLTELRLRENTDIAPLLLAWRAEAPPTDNPPQEAQHLLNWLDARLNPGLTRAEADFQARVRALGAYRPGVADATGATGVLRFGHTRSFEDDRISVEIGFADWARLERCWPRLLAALTETGSDNLDNQAKSES